MTETSKTVFEKYQIRKTKKQKSDFIDYVSSISQENGYKCTVEKGSFGARNIVVGSPDTASIVYTAHYDTCPVLPFPNFITPKKISLYLLYQLIIVVLALIVCVAMGFTLGVIVGIAANLISPNAVEYASILLPFLNLIVWIGILWLILAGPANKHTANDNTSGVTTLLNIMTSLPTEAKEKVAFVFFDLEETGLIGSASFASRHKKTMQDKLLINFDCVSDGDRMLFVMSKKSLKYKELLKNNFSSNQDVSVEILSKGVFYPSDQANFKCGVGVASLKYSKIFKTEYMDRIHTKKDTIYREENIEFLTKCSVNLALNI